MSHSWRELLLDTSAERQWKFIDLTTHTEQQQQHPQEQDDDSDSIPSAGAYRLGHNAAQAAGRSGGGSQRESETRFLVWRTFGRILELVYVDLSADHDVDSLRLRLPHAVLPRCVQCVDDQHGVALWFVLANGELHRFLWDYQNGSSSSDFGHMFSEFDASKQFYHRGHWFEAHSCFAQMLRSQPHLWAVAAWDPVHVVLVSPRDKFELRSDRPIGDKAGRFSCKSLSSSEGLFSFFVRSEPEPTLAQEAFGCVALQLPKTLSSLDSLFVMFEGTGVAVWSSKQRKCLTRCALPEGLRSCVSGSVSRVSPVQTTNSFDYVVAVVAFDDSLQVDTAVQLHLGVSVDAGELEIGLDIFASSEFPSRSTQPLSLSPVPCIDGSRMWLIDPSCTALFNCAVQDPVVELDQSVGTLGFEVQSLAGLVSPIDIPESLTILPESVIVDVSSLDEFFLGQLVSRFRTIDLSVVRVAVRLLSEQLGLSFQDVDEFLNSPSIDDPSNSEKQTLRSVFLRIVDSLKKPASLHRRYAHWSQVLKSVVKAWQFLNQPLAVSVTHNIVLVVRTSSLSLMYPVQGVDSWQLPRKAVLELYDSREASLLRTWLSETRESDAATAAMTVLCCAVGLSSLMEEQDPACLAAMEAELASCHTDASDLINARVACTLRDSSTSPVLANTCRMLRRLSTVNVVQAFALLCSILQPPPPTATNFPPPRRGRSETRSGTNPVKRIAAAKFSDDIRRRYEMSRDLSLLCCVLLRLRLQQPVSLWCNRSCDDGAIQTLLQSETFPKCLDLMKAYFTLGWLSGSGTSQSLLLRHGSTDADRRLVTAPLALCEVSKHLRVPRFSWSEVGYLVDEILLVFQDVVHTFEFLLSFHVLSSHLQRDVETPLDEASVVNGLVAERLSQILAKHSPAPQLMPAYPLLFLQTLARRRRNDYVLADQIRDFRSCYAILCAMIEANVHRASIDHVLDVLCSPVCFSGTLSPGAIAENSAIDPRVRFLTHIIRNFDYSSDDSHSQENVSLRMSLTMDAIAATSTFVSDDTIKVSIMDDLWGAIFANSILGADFESAAHAVGHLSEAVRGDYISRLVDELCFSHRFDLFCAKLPLVQSLGSKLRPIAGHEIAQMLRVKAATAPWSDAVYFARALFVHHTHYGEHRRAASSMYEFAVRLGAEHENAVSDSTTSLAWQLLNEQARCLAVTISSLFKIKTPAERWLHIPIRFKASEIGDGASRRTKRDAGGSALDRLPLVNASLEASTVSVSQIHQWMAVLSFITREIFPKHASNPTQLSVLALTKSLSAGLVSPSTICNVCIALVEEDLVREALDLLSCWTCASAANDSSLELPIGVPVESSEIIKLVEGVTSKCLTFEDSGLWRNLASFLQKHDTPSTNFELSKTALVVALTHLELDAETSHQLDNGPVGIPVWFTELLGLKQRAALIQLLLDHHLVLDASRWLEILLLEQQPISFRQFDEVLRSLDSLESFATNGKRIDLQGRKSSLLQARESYIRKTE